MSASTASLELNGVRVVDTFAEAFSMSGTRLIVTAETPEWARTAAAVACGYATSVIACDVEAGVECALAPDETPDGRPGVAVLMFAFAKSGLGVAVPNRVGQAILTCPTTACYDGLPGVARPSRVGMGAALRFFGDGFQVAKKFGRRRLWRIPVMDGEFVCEDAVGTVKGVGGGNLLFCGRTGPETLAAAQAAVAAIDAVPGVITPFPGGIVRAGSKVGSRYKKLKASTNDAYCPTLRGRTELAIGEEVGAVYEIVIDGLTEADVAAAMAAGLRAATARPGLVSVTAGNYGGKLGPHHFHLRDVVAAAG